MHYEKLHAIPCGAPCPNMAQQHLAEGGSRRSDLGKGLNDANAGLDGCYVEPRQDIRDSSQDIW